MQNYGFSMMNRVQASSTKALINLSNTACEPGSDEKLPQPPGAPGSPLGGTRGVGWDLHGISPNFVGFRSISMGSQWKLIEDHGFAMVFNQYSMQCYGISMMNRVQASSTKALLNLSNTACGPGSDEKLPQPPGGPGSPLGGIRGVGWDLHGISSNFIDSRCFSIDFQ